MGKNGEGNIVQRVMCPSCYGYYQEKSTTSRRSSMRAEGTGTSVQSITAPQHTLREAAIKEIQKNVAAAKHGRGKAKVLPVGDQPPQHLPMGPVIDIPNHSYHSSGRMQVSSTRPDSQASHSQPRPSTEQIRPPGYTKDHLKFKPSLENYARKMSSNTKATELIDLKIIMGVMRVGTTKPCVVGDCVEGVTGVDAHIGAVELHQLCYNTIQKRWLRWSQGYEIPITNTTLRPQKPFVALAGLSFPEQQVPRARDAIWDHFYKPRGKNRVYSFKSEQLSVMICLEASDYEDALAHQESVFPSFTRTTTQTARTRKSTTTRTVGTERAAPSSKKRGRSPTTSDSETSERVPKRRSNFVSPSRQAMHIALKDQSGPGRAELSDAFRTGVTVKCMFYEVPVHTFDEHGLPKSPFSLKDLVGLLGVLTLDESPSARSAGAFKTSHPGSIVLNTMASSSPNATKPWFVGPKVCVKQLYERIPPAAAKKTRRLNGPEELAKILIECNCLNWATILLDLTYGFIHRELDKLSVSTQAIKIPQLQYVRAAIAISPELKRTYLIEEWIDLSVPPGFIKYINNRRAESIVPQGLAPRVHDVAQFLCFAQHVQWQKTGQLVFTSDFQGAGMMLTDPQILTCPTTLGAIFADGNIPHGFTEFQHDHRCNTFCEYFGLSPPSADINSTDDEDDRVGQLATRLTKTSSIS